MFKPYKNLPPIMDTSGTMSDDEIAAAFEMLRGSDRQMWNISEDVMMNEAIMSNREFHLNDSDPENPLGLPGPCDCNDCTDARISEEMAESAAEVLGGSFSSTKPLCGFSLEEGFVWDNEQASKLTAEQRKQIAEHERNHLMFAKVSAGERARAMRQIAEFEGFVVVDVGLSHASAEDFTGFPSWVPCHTDPNVAKHLATDKPVFIDEVNKTPAVVQDAIAAMVGPTPRQEAPCCNCQRPNDLGVKSCWWCEAPNPTASR